MMAADGVNTLDVKLVHGQKIHNLTVALCPEQVGDVLTVKHLADLVETVTNVPISAQKLIVKGRSLKDPSETLRSLGLKKGSKIILIGKPPSPYDDAVLKELMDVEKSLDALVKKQSEISYELDGVHRGFIPDGLRTEALMKLSRRLDVSKFEFERLLDKVDALSIPENHAEGRSKRKKTVDKIQTNLDRIEDLKHGVSEMLARTA